MLLFLLSWPIGGRVRVCDGALDVRFTFRTRRVLSGTLRALCPTCRIGDCSTMVFGECTPISDRRSVAAERWVIPLRASSTIRDARAENEASWIG